MYSLFIPSWIKLNDCWLKHNKGKQKINNNFFINQIYDFSKEKNYGWLEIKLSYSSDPNCIFAIIDNKLLVNSVAFSELFRFIFLPLYEIIYSSLLLKHILQKKYCDKTSLQLKPESENIESKSSSDSLVETSLWLFADNFHRESSNL